MKGWVETCQILLGAGHATREGLVADPLSQYAGSAYTRSDTRPMMSRERLMQRMDRIHHNSSMRWEMGDEGGGKVADFGCLQLVTAEARASLPI